MKLACCRFMLCCLQSPEGQTGRDSSTRIQISEVVEHAPPPAQEESEAESEPEVASAHSDPGNVSADHREIVLPESRSLIFTEAAASTVAKHSEKKPKSAKRKKAETKPKKRNRENRDNGVRRYTPPPKDAKPAKSILKKR